MTPVLAVDSLTVSYRAAVALQDVSLTVAAGAVLGVLGANGAGKSTLARAVAGALPRYATARGRVVVDGSAIAGRSTAEVAATGVAFVPSGKTTFDGLSVQEQLGLRLGRKTPNAERRQRVAEVLDLFPRLTERLQHRGSQLSGGERQMVALAAALVARPRLLILDEPSIGLAPKVVDEVLQRLGGITESGVGILLIEQDVSVVADVADRVVLLRNGTVAMDAASSEALASTEQLRAAYLGEVTRP